LLAFRSETQVAPVSRVYGGYERFFRDLTEKRLRRGVFRNVIWTAKASDILEKVKRAQTALA